MEIAMIDIKISKILAGFILSATVLSATVSAAQAENHAVAEKIDAVKQSAEDTITTGKVNAAMATEKGLQSKGIKVTTKEGVVYLEGSTVSVADKKHAKEVAEHVEGVKKVEENIKVGSDKK